jgi:YbgC/YbaW family acyl-CoA thioester hydrolase
MRKPCLLKIYKDVEFSHTDLAGIVHFSNYGKFMEVAEHAFLAEAGMPVVERFADGSHGGFPRLDVQVRYHLPLRFGDRVELRLRVARLRAGGIEYEVDFHVPQGLAAEGRMKVVYCVFPAAGGLHPALIPENHRLSLERRLSRASQD